MYEDQPDLDHQLELLRQRNVVAGPDLVPKGHLQETDSRMGTAVMSLSDLSQTRLTPNDVVAMNGREAKRSGGSGGTLQSDEETPEASPVVEVLPV